MSFAYLPLFTGDYLRDTRHLTPLKHGVYLLALMYCWDSKGPMPLDEQEAAGICNCRSADEVEALRYVLGRFFVRMEDGHYNERMQREVDRSEAISGVRSNAGRLGANERMRRLREANAKQMPDKSRASAEQVTLSPSPSPSPSKDSTVTPTGLLVPDPAGQRLPPCPTADILSLYHQRLPMLSKVAVLTDTRKKAIAARWREVLHDHKEDRAEALDWFGWYFGRVAESKFLTGRNGKNWRASFDWLVNPSNFAKVIEGNYHREQA